MKSIFKFLSVMAVVLPMSISCGEKEDPTQGEGPAISISSAYFSGGDYSYSLGTEAVSDEIAIECNGNWKVFVPSGSESWISASVLNGNGNGSVTMSFAKNATGAERKGNFYVSAIGGQSINVSVTQTSVEGNSPVTCNYPYDLVLAYQGDKTKYRTYTSDDYLKMLLSNSYIEGGRQWLFDGILMIALTYDGRALCGGYGDTFATKDDWEGLMDFYIYTALPAIEEATTRAEQEMGGLPRKTKVVIMCPAPVADQRDWGSLEGEPVIFDNEEDKYKACEWYVDELVDKYVKADFKKIELSGIYWFEEGLHSSFELVESLADHIHSKGTEFYWIPYFALSQYSHASIKDWKTYGFDRVYYQPNYYFYNVSDDRCSLACSLAANAGFYNMEVEFDGSCLQCYTSDYSAGAAKLRKYLSAFKAAGFSDKYLLAYYCGGGGFLLMTNSILPNDKALYEELAGLVVSRQKKFYKL